MTSLLEKVELTDFENNVLYNIRKAGSNGIKGRILAKILEQKDTRKIRFAIQNMRLQGVPICIAKGGGYLYSEKSENIDNTINDLLSRADELMKISDKLTETKLVINNENYNRNN